MLTKPPMNILAGVIGAVVGFFAGVSLFAISGLENTADPITSGMMALFFFGPAGATGGVFLFTWLAMRFRKRSEPVASRESAASDQAAAAPVTKQVAATPANIPAAGSVVKTGLKAIGVVIVLVAASVGLYIWYAIQTATPWLKPGNVVLQFELRLPAGAPMPAPHDVEIELQTDLNRMPGKLRDDGVRRDGERVVIAGEVDLAFRTRHRQVEFKIKGQPERRHEIRLADTAPHAPELGPWQPHADGSEIRYRAKWPGQR